MAAAALTGCSHATKPQPPEAVPAAKLPPPPKPSKRVSRPPEPRQQEAGGARVAVLYADSVPMYRRMADQLVTRIADRARAYPLHDGALSADHPDMGKYDQVVAIGARAARTARKLPGKPLVFCQVFNFRDYGLTKPNMRGVSMLPPADAHFKAWKSLAPDLKRVAVIAGPGHDSMIAQARTAARRQGVELVDRVAHSDKETLFEFKRLVPEIDGIWLVPDSRILSHRVLRELMTYSAQHRKQVMAFTPELLPFGALMSVSSIESDVIDQVIAALRELAQPHGAPAFRVLALTQAHVEFNAELAHQLGYTLPSEQRNARGR